jgi:hypothetical protein
MPCHDTGKVITFRRPDTILGASLTAISVIDGLLEYVRLEIGAPSIHVVKEMLQISDAGLSRCRHDKASLPEHWIMRMHELSGIPIRELREAFNIPAIVAPHPRARGNVADLRKIKITVDGPTRAAR